MENEIINPSNLDSTIETKAISKVPLRGDLGGLPELRSEEVQDVLGKTPAWILRRGITLLGMILLVLLLGSYVFKYPEIISSPLVLTTSTPPAGIVAKASGKIVELRVKDQQQVKAGDCLAIIENTASYEDVLFLGNQLAKILSNVTKEKTYNPEKEGLQLGAIQASYASLTADLESYNQFVELNYYPRKIESTKRLIAANKLHLQNTLKQKEIVQKQHELDQRAYDRQAYLKKQNLISEEESDKAKGQLLQSNMSVENMQSSIENLKIQILQMEENLVDIEQQYQEKKSGIVLQLNNSVHQLQNEIRAWKQTYLLCSPIDGKVTFSNYWSVNQNVTAGQAVFTVVPKASSQLIGKALLPAERSGKVKPGQKVQVHFVNYPDNEFGMVVGKVNRISLVPTDGKYTVEVLFPNGLQTTYGKKLPLSQEMAANADIITNDMRLIEQFFMPIKRVLKNNM